MPKLSSLSVAPEVTELREKVTAVRALGGVRSAEVTVDFIDESISDEEARKLVSQARDHIHTDSTFRVKAWNSWRSGKRPARIHVTIKRRE